MTADPWFPVAVIKGRSTTETQENTFQDEGTVRSLSLGGGYTITKIHRTVHFKWLNFTECK